MLSAGTTLGPYKILAALGAGGMGEVYRAHDSRLGRDVAIKVLAPHLAATPEARARFEREARTISQLNHPHICTLYDIGREGSTDFLVMELLEGETLAHRLEKEPLPPADTLALGVQIADALDRAHRAGVVHRDLKPANVMLTKSGAKLMDFGLARRTVFTAPREVGPDRASESKTVGQLPAASSPLTAEGAIVGTVLYMAPEQLEGEEADARTDLWALGCVLYEMATGRRAFEGTSQASLIAAILKETPRPMTELQPLMPPALDRTVRQCLAKDPDARWQSAGDLARELEWVAATSAVPQVGLPVLAYRRRRERLAWAGTCAATALALLAFAALLRTHRLPVSEPVRFSIASPAGMDIVTDSPSPAVSPDGRRLVFTVLDSAGTQHLWIRPLDSSSAQRLPGTEGANLPFWSPESRFIAFFADGKLKKVPATGGATETICDAPDGRGGSWSKEGVIVFAPGAAGPLQRVSSEGGEAVAVARPDLSRGENGLRFPCFLPDGRHFLYASMPRREGQFDIYIGDVQSGENRHFMTAGSAPVYAEPGFLLFAHHDRTVAQRLDLPRLRLTGSPIALADVPNPGYECAPPASSPARDVLVRVVAASPNTELEWLDRSGHPAGKVPLPPGRYVSPSLSPDGRSAALIKKRTGIFGDLWTVDLGRAFATRLTFDGLVDDVPLSAWSPDGYRLTFLYNRSDTYDIYQLPANGSGGPEPLLQSRVVNKGALGWSPDGKYLVFYQIGHDTGWDIWLLPLGESGQPIPYLCSPANQYPLDISPDGRWLVYTSDETGSLETYVRAFPVPGEAYRILTPGARWAHWSEDGHELIIGAGAQIGAQAPVYSVAVRTEPAFEVGTPQLLFEPRRDLVGITATRDHIRFLAIVPVEETAPPSLEVVLNWQEALKR